MYYARVQVETQGTLLKVKRRDVGCTFNQSYNGRGEITNFSSQSRSRMLEMFSRLDKKRAISKRVLFITLTYQWRMVDFQRAKRDLKVFLERVVDKFGGAWIVWKMEQQKSGSIHFHLMVGNVGYWKVGDAQGAWNEVSGQTARNSLDLKPVKSVKRLMSYVSKYMAKVGGKRLSSWYQTNMALIASSLCAANGSKLLALLGLSLSHIISELPDVTGRFWGVWGRKNMPYADMVHTEINVTLYGYMLAVSKMCNEYAVWWQNWKIYSEKARWLYDRFIGVATSTSRNYFANHWFKHRLESIRDRMGSVWDDMFVRYKYAREKEIERLLFIAWAARVGRLAEFGYESVEI